MRAVWNSCSAAENVTRTAYKRSSRLSISSTLSSMIFPMIAVVRASTCTKMKCTKFAVSVRKNDVGSPSSDSNEKISADEKANMIASAPTVNPRRLGSTPTAISAARVSAFDQKMIPSTVKATEI